MNHRHQAVARAKKLLAKQPIYLDTETTGTSPTAEIVEICLVDDSGEVLLDSLVKPRGRIPAAVVEVHGITNQMVAGAPTWAELWPRVHTILKGRSIGIYNRPFDLRMMRQSHQQAGLRWSGAGATAFCVMQLYADFYGQWNARRRSYKWQSLASAGRQCGLTLPNAHRAKADTLLTRAVMHYMAGVS